VNKTVYREPWVLSVVEDDVIWLRVLGRWTEEDFQEFDAAIRQFVEEIRATERHFHLILDISEYRVQTIRMRERFEVLIKWGVQNGLIGGINLVSRWPEIRRRLMVLARGSRAVSLLRFHRTVPIAMSSLHSSEDE